MASVRPSPRVTGLFCSPAWIYELSPENKIEFIRFLTRLHFKPTTKSIDFGLETRHLPRALVGYFTAIEEQVFSTNEDGSTELKKSVDGIVNLKIWFALLSLAKWLGCDMPAERSRLHVREEHDINGKLRMAYGVMLVEQFPEINTQGASRSQPASTESSFYRWGYIDNLPGDKGIDGSLESDERESRKQDRSPLSPDDVVRSTERSPSSEKVPAIMIQTMNSAIDFCIEVGELRIASHSNSRHLAHYSNVYMEDIFQRHDELWKDILHDAAEVLEIASDNPGPKSWENHVICVYMQHHLVPMSFKLSEWERESKNSKIEPGREQQDQLDDPELDAGAAPKHEESTLIMPGWTPVRGLQANDSWSPRYLRQCCDAPVTLFSDSVDTSDAHLSMESEVSVTPKSAYLPHVEVGGFKRQRSVSGSERDLSEKIVGNKDGTFLTPTSRLPNSLLAPETPRRPLPSSPPH